MGACCGMDQFTWIVVMTTIVGFVYAFGIGANDVANAFGSTVASGSLSLKQAVMVAAVMEFCGALFLGASVTNTVRSKIFDYKDYEDEPEIVMLGMFTSLLTGAVMLLGKFTGKTKKSAHGFKLYVALAQNLLFPFSSVATAYALPVSTTHTIVGCIMGFTIAAKGIDSVNWEVVSKIAMSWIISPVSSGLIGFLFFICVERGILMSPKPFDRTYAFFPVILTIFIGIDVFYVINKGLANTDIDLTAGEAMAIGAGFGVASGLAWVFVIGPWAKRRIDLLHPELAEGYVAPEVDAEAEMGADGEVLKEDSEDIEEIDVDSFMEARAQARAEGKSDADIQASTYTSTSKAAPSVQKPKPTPIAAAPKEEAAEPTSRFGKWYKDFADSTFDQDLHQQSFDENKRVGEISDGAKHYDFKAERMFTYVQVFTACLNSFAHGANDVANAIAPISAVFLIWNYGELKSKAEVQKWILAYGGFAIVVGLLLYGYKVMKTIGYKMTYLSPSRGGCAELAASLVVVTASYMEIPVSSTQCIVGAVNGVGLVGGVKNVQWLVLLKVSISWVVTFFIASLLSGLIFAMFAYSPSLATPIVDPTDEPTMAPTFNTTFNSTL
jgi:solute carrier family 20 (sodium-dependent phosphate transporter)